MERNKKKLYAGLALIVIGGVLLAWTLLGGRADAPSGVETNLSDQPAITDNSQAAESEETAETATIDFTDDGFSPAELRVKQGTVVTVTNSSSTRMQFSSDDHPTHRINQGMNLPVLAPGESATFTADKVGNWGFHCHLNDQHTGMLSVEG